MRVVYWCSTRDGESGEFKERDDNMTSISVNVRCGKSLRGGNQTNGRRERVATHLSERHRLGTWGDDCRFRRLHHLGPEEQPRAERVRRRCMIRVGGGHEPL